MGHKKNKTKQNQFAYICKKIQLLETLKKIVLKIIQAHANFVVSPILNEKEQLKNRSVNTDIMSVF